jgi:RNA polymerase sigma-70 factor (ECF subfamily)
LTSSTTLAIHQSLLRLQAGEAAARGELIRVSQKRVVVIARHMFRRFPRLRAWEETDDVVQNALLRLHRSLEDISPATVREFLGLASLQIRRTLLDLTRSYFGPEGLATKQAHGPGDAPSTSWLEAALVTGEPQSLEDWADFHEFVAALPEEEREVFDLLWYQGLTQAEAAEVLGVSERSVRRRWFSARERLKSHGKSRHDKEP